MNYVYVYFELQHFFSGLPDGCEFKVDFGSDESGIESLNGLIAESKEIENNVCSLISIM
jgi:hypothetical protein